MRMHLYNRLTVVGWSGIVMWFGSAEEQPNRQLARDIFSLPIKKSPPPRTSRVAGAF
jgi:hypothetical protein